MSDSMKRRLVALAALGLCCNCVPALRGPAFKAPNTSMPGSYLPKGERQGMQDVASPETSDKALPTAAPVGVAHQAWQHFFSSPHLRSLIDQAVANNQELNIRLQELVIARAEVSARQGDYLPRVGAQVGGGIEKVGKFTSQGASDEALGVPKNLGNFTFGLVGSWEADVWNKLHDAKKAANMRYLASVESQRFLVTQTVAEIARAYYELLAVDRRLDILAKSIKIQEDTLAMVKLEMQAARVTQLAVQRFEAELMQYKSRVFRFQQERIQIENKINFLVGRYPQPIERDAGDFQGSLALVEGTGLPAELLENRTDVLQAQWALQAAKLDVKVAKKAFFPALTLDAAVGYRAFNTAHLITTPASLFYDAAGGLVAPLLNRRAITAQYEMANAKQVQAVINYEQTLLRAFTDVANELSAVSNWRATSEQLGGQVAMLADAVEVSAVLFQGARAEYIEVLTTRRDFLEAQMELIEVDRRSFAALVGVYQALGGGWRSQSVSALHK